MIRKKKSSRKKKKKNKKMTKKVVLAYSGGLDTSYCAKYLADEKNLEVHSVLVNTGGFSQDELNAIEKKAKILGVHKHISIDVKERYYDHCIRYLVYGNILRNGTYPLSVSAERVFQAMTIADYANQINADYIAHGSTGAGNDQVRFDMIFNIMAPQVEIITPIRDQKLSRETEINFLKSHGIEMDWSRSLYSINQGLWGTSVGGKETLTSDKALPDEAYPTKITKKDPEKFELLFEQGEFSGFNNRNFSSKVEAIEALNTETAGYGIGRDIHVGDTIIGIKGRVGFEAAAPILIIKTHQALEKHVLGKWQIYWKDQLADWYGMLLHEGQYLDPVMRDIEAFLDHSQSNVSGKVFVKIAANYFNIEGIESKYDLMSSGFGSYGELNLGWDGNDVRGFAKMLSNSSKIYKTVNKLAPNK
jgi:argininosuccinate synthase